MERAIRSAARTELRSEDSASSLDLFVDYGQLEQLDSRNWQVVWGRRGTGKTHLLRALEASRNLDLAERKELWLYFSVNDFTLSPPNERSDSVLAMGFFQRFFKIFVQHLVSDMERISDDSSLLNKLLGDGKASAALVGDVALELLELVNFGDVVPAFADVELEEEVTRTNRNERRVGGSLKVGTKGIDFGIDAGAGVSQSLEGAVVQTLRAGAQPNLARARERIADLLGLLRIEHVYILLDEWTTLDRSGTTNVQPEFANLLVRFFGQSPNFTIKIAANRFQTRLFSKGKGLELEADIFEGINLDRAVYERRDLEGFYRELLFRRLAQHDEMEFVAQPRGSSDEISRDKSELPDWELCIFEDRACLAELVAAAEGIPRRFLGTFASMATQKRFRLTDLWELRDVQSAIRAKTVHREAEIDYWSRPAELLRGPILDAALATGDRRFLIKKDDLPFIRDEIDELLDKRFVHEFPPMHLPAKVREQYFVYLTDYGTWLEWERGFDSQDGAGTSRFADQDWSAIVDLEEFRVCVDDFRHESVTCPECLHSFPADDPLYQRHQICPNSACLEVIHNAN